VLNYHALGGYHSIDYYNKDHRIKKVIDQLTNGFFAPSPSEEFIDLHKSLIDYNDEYFLLRDFASFDAARAKGELLYNNKNKWLEMCINNLAYAGKFGSDETILKYAVDIWNIKKSVIKNDMSSIFIYE